MSLNRAVSTVRGCRAVVRDSGVGRRSRLESRTIAGDSPVFETEKDADGT